MKNLKMNLELLQTLNPLCQYYLFIKDQLPVRRDQLPVPTLRIKTVSTVTNVVQQVRKTVLLSDLYVLTNNEHWTVTPETHKYAATAGSFCFVTTENGEQQDVCNLTTMPCVQRSLCLDEVTTDQVSIQIEVPRGVGSQTRDTLVHYVATCGKAAGAKAKMRSRARKEASTQETQGYYKQFAEAKHLEHKFCVDNEVFDLIDMRRVKPEELCDRTMSNHHQDGKAGQFL